MFKPRVARRSLDRYRSKGLDRIERSMLASASAGGVDGARVLEIGGGIGTIQSELLVSGAARGEVVELVQAWEPYAAELAREKGLDERTRFRVADILENPEAVEPADVVIMNRVVCCSPDGVELTGTAARLAGHTLVLSFPRDAFWLRAGVRAMNATFKVMGWSFRAFVHPRGSLVAAAEREGMKLTAGGHGFAWEYMAFDRAT
jgi:hypothetical protein